MTADDPLIRAIAESNPVSEADFADLPALGPLPRRRGAPAHRRRIAGLAAAAVLAVAAFAAFALTPSSTPGSSELLKRALAAQQARTSEILYWRLQTHDAGLDLDYTEDLWLHMNANGRVDRVHELRLDGRYAGLESEIHQPNGLADPRGASDRTRQSADGPIRTAEGYGYSDTSFSAVIATALDAAKGGLDVEAATEVRHGDRDAYEIRLKDATPLTPGTTRRNPAQVSVTLWLDRETLKPLAVRWGEGDELWRTVEVQEFKRLPDNPTNRRLLALR